MARQVSISKFQEMMAAERQADDTPLTGRGWSEDDSGADPAETSTDERLVPPSSEPAPTATPHPDDGLGERMADRAERVVGTMVATVGDEDQDVEAKSNKAGTGSDEMPEGDSEHLFDDSGASWAVETVAENGSSPADPGPKHILRVPSDAEFGDDEFFVSTALAARARVLAERHDELSHLTLGSSYSVVYLWKKAGGKSKGRGVFGKTTKPSGLLKLFSEATWVIWLAADHCRAVDYGDRELEALLFHEMLHTGIAEEDEETGRGGGPTMIPHDVEMFRAEVEVYGLWAAELREVGPAFAHQMSLFDVDEEATAIYGADGLGAGGVETAADEARIRREIADPDGPSPEDDDILADPAVI